MIIALCCLASSPQVWAMKEAEVAALVRQLLQADKVIHEQQLGWAWQPPDDALFLPASHQAHLSAAGLRNAAATSRASSKRSSRRAGASATTTTTPAVADGTQPAAGQEGSTLHPQGQGSSSEPAAHERGPRHPAASGEASNEGDNSGGEKEEADAAEEEECDSELDEEQAAVQRAEAELQERLQDPLAHSTLALLVDEAGFLVDARVR